MLPSGNFPCRKVPVKSRFSGGGILCRINKLPNLRALLLEVGQMLLANFLVDLELLLGAAFFAGANIRLPQTVVSVGQIGIEFQRALILRNRFYIFILVGVEIAQLQVSFRELRIELQRLSEQRFDLMQIPAGILGPPALP